jgi:1,4-dihydroxy-6-naphthoate synthase
MVLRADPCYHAVMKKIQLGHSPDADDAFMFYGLATGKIDTGVYKIEHVLEDIQTLNDRATRGQLEITAISAHAYAYARDKYILTRCGGSFGDGYGPKIVSREPMAVEALGQASIAVPGTTTSAFLALQIFRADLKTKVLPFDKIIQAVQTGVVDCGLIIHEGQVTYDQMGLFCVADLGAWWQKKTGGLPLPLGLNAIRKDLPRQDQQALTQILLESIRYSLAHRAQAVAHAMTFARDMPQDLAAKFIGMYVNELTLDMGDRGRKAVEEFLGLGARMGLVPDALPLEIV